MRAPYSVIQFKSNSLAIGIAVAITLVKPAWSARSTKRMTFRIQTSVNEETVTLTVSGRLNVDGIAELKRLVEGYRDDNRLVLDLKDVGLVDRFAIRSLTAFEDNGVRLMNCPSYIRDWILRTSDHPRVIG